MLFYRKYLLIIFCFLELACTSKKEIEDYENFKVIKIDNKNDVKKFNSLDSYLDFITLTPIKQVEGAYLAQINGFIETKNNYIISDPFIAKKVNLFDKKGNFIKTIIKQGDGPNDLPQIIDVFLSPDGFLHVMDYSSRKIITYDSLYNVKKIIKNIPYASNFQKLPNGDFFSYTSPSMANEPINNHYYRFIHYDQNFKVKNVSLPYNEKVIGTSLGNGFINNFTVYNDDIVFNELCSNNIYYVNDKGLVPRYKLKYAEYNLPEDFYEEIVEKDLDDFKMDGSRTQFWDNIGSKYATQRGFWLENNKYIYISSLSPKANKSVNIYTLYDKTTGVVISNTNNFYLANPDISGLELRFLDNYDQSFVQIVSGYNLNLMIGKTSPFRKYLSNGLGMDDMYILKIKLKNK